MERPIAIICIIIASLLPFWSCSADGATDLLGEASAFVSGDLPQNTPSLITDVTMIFSGDFSIEIITTVE